MPWEKPKKKAKRKKKQKNQKNQKKKPTKETKNNGDNSFAPWGYFAEYQHNRDKGLAQYLADTKWWNLIYLRTAPL